jgi:ELWxxDGT repeat protein
VKDLRAGATGSSAVGLANVGGTLYFTADDGVNGWSLWRTDGTDAGTTQFAGPVQGFGPVVLGTVGRDVYGQVGGFTLWKQTPADAVAPTVVGRSFDFQGGPHGVVLEFSEDVSASLAAADLVVTPIDGGATIAPAATALAYDPRNNAAALTFPGLAGGRLPDGNYRVTAAGGGVTDAAGNPLVAFTFDFFVLAGDANRDRVVNFDDLLTLAKNYNGAAKTYAEGDFDGNGTVNFDDLLVLAKNYNKVLPEPVTAPSASPTFGSAVAGATSEVLAGGNVAVFSTTPVDKPAAKPRPTPPYKPAGASATSKKPALTRQI